MGIRYDKFAVGDQVTWADDGYANLTNGLEGMGPGPFRVDEVFDREYDPPYDDEGQSNWASMGHTQHLLVAGRDTMWSGAFFKLVTTEGSAT